MRARALQAMVLGAALGAAPLAQAQTYGEGEGGVLRWLDKSTGRSGDVSLQRGQAASNGRLTIQLNACRYPTANPAAEAEAHLTVLDSSRDAPVFQGWMLASSPALSAMEHPRYDVWVLRCMVAGYRPPQASDQVREGTDEEDSDEITPEGEAP